jgi:hypothetical protein
VSSTNLIYKLMKQLLFVFLIINVTIAKAQTDTSRVIIDTTAQIISVIDTLNPNVIDSTKKVVLAKPKVDKKPEKEPKEPFFTFLKSNDDKYKPKKAAFYSTIIPGGGQVYNRQYWKAPLAFGGVATAGYFVFLNTNEYRKFRTEYRYRVDDDPNTVGDEDLGDVSDANIITARDGYQKRMEQSYIAVVLVYGLNVIEAYTSAHLMNFDVDEDLSLNMQPNVRMGDFSEMQVGLSLSFQPKVVSVIGDW